MSVCTQDLANRLTYMVLLYIRVITILKEGVQPPSQEKSPKLEKKSKRQLEYIFGKQLKLKKHN